MPATQPSDVTGFVLPAIGRARTWHTNADCARRPRANQSTVTGANWVALAQAQTRKGRTPCLTCALDAVIDDCQKRPTGIGYHALTCGDGYEHYCSTHYYRTGEGPPCDVCAALLAYAHKTGTLVATAGERVTILAPGTYAGGGRDLFGTLLVGDNAAGVAAGVTAPMWKIAAALIGAHGLAAALQAANAVYAPLVTAGAADARTVREVATTHPR